MSYPTEAENIQGKKFPGYGVCIYCGSDGHQGGLRDEHIIPFSLGGRAIIQGASCEDCERVTSYLDGYLGRNTFHEYRAHAGTPSRKPKKRPKVFPARIIIDGKEEIQQMPPANHPYYLALPVWGLPGILNGLPP